MHYSKLLVAMALAGISTISVAQESSVTVYGLVDMGYSWRGDNYADGTKSRSGIDSGQASGSRIGFRGQEQLAPGLKAIFTIEAGINADTGAAGQNGLAWGRQTTVGFDYQGTKVQFGRQLSPIYAIYAAYEPFGVGTVGQASNVIKNISKYIRLDNSVSVSTPFFWDVVGVEALYSLHATGTETLANDKDVRYGALYGKVKFAKQFYVIGGYNQAKTSDLDNKYRAWDVLGVADLSFARFTLGYEYAKTDGDVVTATGETKSYNRIHAGAKVPFGNYTLLASYNYSKDKQDLNEKAQQFSLGGTYNLSKRTDVYLVYSKITTGDGLGVDSGYDLGDQTFANNSATVHTNGYRSGVNAGVRLRF